MNKKNWFSFGSSRGRGSKRRQKSARALKSRALKLEALECRQLLSLSDLLAQMTPNPHPTGEQPHDGARAVVLSAYTPGELPPKMGDPDIDSFVDAIEQLDISISHNSAARPSYWGEATAVGGDQYRLYLNDNGMLVNQWTINWGDGSDPQTVSNDPWVVHAYAGGSSQHTVSVSAHGRNGTYVSGAGGDTGGGLDQGFNSTADDSTDVLNGRGPRPNWVIQIGNQGQDVSNFEENGGFDQGRIAALDTGNLLAVGTTGDGKFGLVRYLDIPGLPGDGDPDLNFGTDGMLTTSFAAGTASASAVAVDGVNGLIVVAGVVVDGNGHNEIALARYSDADGSLDTAFGPSSDGKVATDLGTGWEATKAVVIESNGSLLVAGTMNGHFALVHYAGDGTRDTDFGGATDGIVTADFSGTNETLSAMALDGNGHVFLAGTTEQSGTGKDFVLARFNLDGTLDTTFGSGITPTGFMTADFGGDETATALAIQPTDGKILVGGYSTQGGSDSFALVRFNADGYFDYGFGNAGKVTTSLGDGGNRITGVQVQNDGKIVVCGTTLLDDGGNLTTDEHWAVVRYNADGTPDGTFGTGALTATVTTDFSILGFSTESSAGLILDATGRIVVAGTATQDDYSSFAVSCYDPGAAGLGMQLSDIPPMLRVAADQDIPAGQSFSFSPLGVFSHPAQTGNFTYQIDWGDGSTPDTGIATILDAGSADSPLTGSLDGAHSYANSGVYYVAITVFDPNGGSATQTLQVTANVIGGEAIPPDDSGGGEGESGGGEGGLEPMGDLVGALPSDPVLLAAIRQALALPAGATVGTADMARLTSLYLDSNKVTTLSGLDNAVNLQTLTIVPSDFSDPGHLTNSTSFSVLANLTHLTNLTLQRCGLNGSELTSTILNGLTSLTSLDLRYNNIAIVSTAIAHTAGLTMLYVYGNPLTDNPRAGLATLAGKLLTVDIAPDHPENALKKYDITNVNTAQDVYNDLADAFYDLPIPIYQYLVNTIQYQPYQGAMKGPIAVLQTGAGNDWDIDSLMVKLLQRASSQAGLKGNPTLTPKYDWGRVLMDMPTVVNWLGVKTPEAAYDALVVADLNPILEDKNTNSALSPATQMASAAYVAFDHAWVEMSVTLPGGTQQTVCYLDPTWKFKDFQPGVPGILNAVTFATDPSANSYLNTSDASVQKETVADYYEGLVQSYLADTGHPERNGLTIADVPYDGPIRQQVFTSLPTILPFHGLTYPYPDSTTGIVGWGNNHFYQNSPDPSVIPDALIHTVGISVAIPQGTNTVTCTVNADGTTTLVAASGSPFTSAVVGGSVVLDNAPTDYQAFEIKTIQAGNRVIVYGNANYPGTFAVPGLYSLQDIPVVSLERITIGYASATPLKPRLYLNGADTADSTIDAASNGNIKLVLQIYAGNTGGNQTQSYSHVYTRGVGKFLAVGLDAAQDSAQFLTATRKVANDANISKVNGGTVSDELLAGSMLNLAMVEFFNSCDSADESLGGLTDAMPLYGLVASGITTADSALTDTGTADNLQIRYLPSSMGIDVPSANWHSTSIDETTVTCTPSPSWPNYSRIYSTEDIAHYALMGYNSSSTEALIWEDLSNTQSICTAKSLQVAYKANGTSGVITIPANSTQSYIDTALSSLGGTGTSGPQIRTDIYNFSHQGYSVRVPTSYTDIGSGSNKWHGVGYFVYDSSGTDIANIIDSGDGLPHGGWTGGDPTPVPQPPSLPYPATLGDPIDIANGNVMHDETDISIPNLGAPLSFGRHYASNTVVGTSVTAWSDRGMGEGWSFTYGDSLTAYNSTIDGTQPAGTMVWFTDSGVRLLFAPTSPGATTYTSPASIFGNLVHHTGSDYTWTDTSGNTMVFYENGKLWKRLDRYGDGIQVFYNGSNIDCVKRVLNNAVASPECSLTFTYNGDSTPHITSISDKTGRTWRYGYDSSGRLVSVTAPTTSTMPLSLVQYAYYTESDVRKGLLQAVTDPDGNTTQYAYYVNRRGFQVTDGQGNVHTVSHDVYRNRTDFIDERGYVSYYDYWDDGHEKTQQNPDLTTVGYIWDANGRKTSDTNAFGQAESFVYNDTANPTPNGNITKFTDRMGRITDFTYTDYSNPSTSYRESDGAWTHYYYFTDTNGKYSSLQQVVDALGNTTSYTYPSANRGQPQSMTSPNGNATGHVGYYMTWYEYNDAGQTMAVYSPVATTSATQPTRASHAGYTLATFLYDNSDLPTHPNLGQGFLTSSTDGNGNTTYYTYDILGRRLTQTQPDPDGGGLLVAPVAASVYDAVGNVISTGLATADRQQVTGTVFDKMGRVTKTINADGTYQTAQYDAAGNLVRQTDAMGQLTQFVYDSRGRLTTTIRPDGTMTRTAYNGGGLVVIATDANGNTAHYTYDKLSRKTTEIAPYADSNTLQTVDDGDSTGFSTSGSWTTVSGSGGLAGAAGGQDYRYTTNTANYATWTFNVQRGHRYEILVTWVDKTPLAFNTPPTLNSTAAFYSVYDGTTSGTLKGSVLVNQRNSPPVNPVFTDADWLSLGYFFISDTGTLTVKLTNSDGGCLVADAVRIIELAQTSYTYDAQGNLQYVVNAQGKDTSDTAHTTQYYYDKLGRKTAEKLPDPDDFTRTGGTNGSLPRPITLYGYDANGNLTSTVDARGASDDSLDAYGTPTDAQGNDGLHKTTYKYDEQNRKIIDILPDPNGGSANLYVWYYYDNNGNLIYTVDSLYATSSRPATWSAPVEYTTEYDYDALNRKVTEKKPDPDGYTGANDKDRPITNYSFDNSGNVVAVTDPMGSVTRTSYDLRNRPVQVTDALGAYAGDAAHTTVTTFDAVGNAIFFTNALGAVTSFQYDAMNRKVLQIAPLPDAASTSAPQTKWKYDNNGNLWKTTDPRGNVTETDYDGWNRLYQTVNALGGKTVTVYDTLSRVMSVTDPLYRTTSYGYDNLGRKIKMTQPAPDDYRSTGGDAPTQSAPVTYYGYDSDGNLKYVTDPRGSSPADSAHTTWYFYDYLNRQTCVADALANISLGTYAIDGLMPATQINHSTVTTYDALGDAVTVISPVDAATNSFRTVNYTYDKLGRKLTTVQHDANTGTYPTTVYAYDNNSRLVSTTDPHDAADTTNHTSWIVYDALGRTVRTVSQLGNGPNDTHYDSLTNYDALGNVLSITDADGNSTSYAYDRLSRQTASTNVFHYSDSTQYDLAGNVTKTIDRNGNAIAYGYDALNRQIEEDWLNASQSVIHTATKTYDAVGQLVSVADTECNYQYAYDQDGRLLRSRMAPSDAPAVTPTPFNGTLDANSATSDWDNDGVQERVWILNINSVRIGDVLSLHIHTDGFIPVLIILRPNGSYFLVSSGQTDFSYPFTANSAGTWTVWVTCADVVTGNLTLTLLGNPTVPRALTEMNYTYDAAGNMLTATDGSDIVTGKGGLLTYSYDNLNRMTDEYEQSASGSSGITNKHIHFTYDDAGETTKIQRYASLGTSNLVATTNYVKQDGTTSGYDGMGRVVGIQQTFGSTTQNYDYQFDQDSRIKQMISPDGTDNYTLDNTDQLLAASLNGEGYSYDQNGNCTSTGWTTGADNRLITAKDTSGTTYTYLYDKDGNRALKFVDNNHDGLFNSGDTSATLYYYDNRNRLTEVDFATGYGGTYTKLVAYSYDYLNRQIVRYLDSQGDGNIDSIAYSVYQGENVLDQFSDNDGLSNSIIPTTLAKRNLYGPAVDQIFATDNGSTTGSIVRWGLADHEGTIREVIDSSGVSKDHIKYDSYGNPTGGTSILTDFLFGWAGMQYDPDSKLYMTDSRPTDPQTHTFLSKDPTSPPPSMNFYEDSGNNWILYADPTGDCLQSVWNGISNTVSDAWSSIRPTVAQAAVNAIGWGWGAYNSVSSYFASPSPRSTWSDAPEWTNNQSTKSIDVLSQDIATLLNKDELTVADSIKLMKGLQGDTVGVSSLGMPAMTEIPSKNIGSIGDAIQQANKLTTASGLTTLLMRGHASPSVMSAGFVKQEEYESLNTKTQNSITPPYTIPDNEKWLYQLAGVQKFPYDHITDANYAGVANVNMIDEKNAAKVAEAFAKQIQWRQESPVKLIVLAGCNIGNNPNSKVIKAFQDQGFHVLAAGGFGTGGSFFANYSTAAKTEGQTCWDVYKLRPTDGVRNSKDNTFYLYKPTSSSNK